MDRWGGRSRVGEGWRRLERVSRRCVGGGSARVGASQEKGRKGATGPVTHLHAKELPTRGVALGELHDETSDGIPADEKVPEELRILFRVSHGRGAAELGLMKNLHHQLSEIFCQLFLEGSGSQSLLLPGGRFGAAPGSRPCHC